MKDFIFRGYKSTKLQMAYIVMLLISLGWLATAKWHGLEVTFPEFIMGLLAAAGIAYSGNLVDKHILTKKLPKTDSEEK